MAAQWAAIARRERSMYSSGSSVRRRSASSVVRRSGMYPFSGSWALVWSVTMSASKPSRSRIGRISAALPSSPTLSARRSAFAARQRAIASARSVASSSR